MRDKSCRISVANKRFAFKSFICLFMAIEILLEAICVEYLAVFSIRGSRVWMLATIVTVFAVGSLVLSWNLERNCICLISGTIIPVLIYKAISMWKYSVAIRVALTVGGTIAAVEGFYQAARKVSRIEGFNCKRTVFTIEAARISQIICCLILIGACIYGRCLIVNQYAVSFPLVTPQLFEESQKRIDVLS